MIRRAIQERSRNPFGVVGGGSDRERIRNRNGATPVGVTTPLRLELRRNCQQPWSKPLGTFAAVVGLAQMGGQG